MKIESHAEPSSIFFRFVEDCSEPMMISDKSGTLQYVNPAWEKIYGYSKDEAIGKTPRLLRSHFQDAEFYKKMWSKILDPKIERWKGEVVNRAKDGTFVPVLLTIAPYKENGETVGYMAIAVDLTERRSMEQQIRRQDRLASIGILASSLAHEIGNPLGVIRGRAEIILNSLRGCDDAEQSAVPGLDTIINQIDRISRLIESLLKISRAPKEAQLTNIELEPLVKEVLALMSENLRRKGIKLELKMTPGENTVLADTNYLQQILLNLLINSVHAIEDQKKQEPSHEHTIQIGSFLSAKERITFFVEDTGCGITPEVRSRMFDPFFTTKIPGQGTGLGLSIVLRLTEEMHGTVVVKSEGPGHGTRIEIQLKSSSPKSPADALTKP